MKLAMRYPPARVLANDELMDGLEENRYILELSCTERETYRIEPYCQD